MAQTSEAAVETLRATLRGELLEPGDEAYEQARRLYNGMIDKHPRFIARCRDIADVIAAVRFSREHDLLTSIRSGGHNGPGLALCDDGLVIDLSQMRGIRVDPQRRTVRVEPGCVWGDVDHATHAFGLAVPSGIISTTGVGGLTLGGGHGYLARKYGLTIDSLNGADVVLADGSFVRANSRENEDLFWALRGGGGNFGVVTSLEYRLHPVSAVYAGPTLWHLDQADEVLRWYRSWLPEAPEDVYGFFAFMAVPPVPPYPPELHGRTMCGIVWCYAGPPANAAEALEPVGELPRPAFELLGQMPYPALQSLFDPLYPPGLQWYWRGDFVREISDEAIERHLEYGSQLPTLHSTMHLYPIDGAVHRVGTEDTAFSYRDVRWSQVIVGVDADPENREKITGWTKQYWEALHPFSAGGAYVNFMMEEGAGRVKATYRDNYERLVEVKRKYDPDNHFRVNQNIAPDSP